MDLLRTGRCDLHWALDLMDKCQYNGISIAAKERMERFENSEALYRHYTDSR